jgi:hypothetical protein
MLKKHYSKISNREVIVNTVIRNPIPNLRRKNGLPLFRLYVGHDVMSTYLWITHIILSGAKNNPQPSALEQQLLYL